MNRIIILTLSLVAGITIGSIAGFLVVQSKSTVIRKALPPEILTERVVHKVFGNTSGTITNITKEFFTLSKNGQSLDAYLDFRGVTRLVKSDTGEQLQYQDIKVGDEVVAGGVSVVVYTSNPSEIPGRLYAHFWRINQK